MVHGPQPRDYAQRTPKKMKAAALRGALSDRARDGRVHVVSGFVPGAAPSTKVGRRDPGPACPAASTCSWSWSARTRSAGSRCATSSEVHLLVPDQLNTYDVLVSDDVVFTQGAFEAFLGWPGTGHG